jgi:hypothetical protein
VFNGAQSILRSDDKAQTYLALKSAGLPMPRTILAPKTFPAVGYPETAFVDEAARALGLPWCSRNASAPSASGVFVSRCGGAARKGAFAGGHADAFSGADRHELRPRRARERRGGPRSGLPFAHQQERQIFAAT